MSRFPSEEIIVLVRDLVRQLTGFEDDSEPFVHCVNYTVSTLARADTMSFVNRKEMDAAVSGLAEKFRFHGFGPQADELRAHYAALVPRALAKARLDDRLNALKFLVCLSESPTTHFLENPVRKRPVEREERIDWSAYLREGIEQWSPTYTSSSDGWTNDSGDDRVDRGAVESSPAESPKFTADVETLTERPIVEYRELRRTLAESVQNVWFAKEDLQEVPESTNVDARISFHWDEYVEHASHGLLVQKSNVLTEYKVMREVIWQFWRPHTSTCFAFVGNKLAPKENVSVSSVRPTAFKAFAREFLPYIDTLQSFRDFRKSLGDESEIFKPPGTYFSYGESLEQIIAPFFERLIELEDEVRRQKTIMTLLKLASKLRDIFGPVAILKRIHDEVVIDFKSNSPAVCATTLLSRLHHGLLNCATSKKEFDIYLTLYVASLFRYFQIINWWFNNDSLVDGFDEFVIVNGNATESIEGKFLIETVSKAPYETVCFSDSISSDSDLESGDSRLRFSPRQLDDIAAQDSVLTIIATEVTQIGKNIRHLHTLHKLHLLKTKATNKLYFDFTAKLLRRISDYFEAGESGRSTPSDNDEPISYKFPAMCPDYVKYPTDMDKLENLVDTSDGFLMEAFKPFFTEKPRADRGNEKTLYEKISETTKAFFPIERMLVEAFSEVFRDRYANSGFIVRDLLFNEYRIEDHFDLLGHLFLFRDDLLSPWYRRLFQQMEKGTHFDSDIWLTAHLHDVLMDSFPSLYERCTVKASDMWNFYRDPLKACGMVTIEYFVDWPISMIIRRDQIEMYKHIFQFVLQIKWALYTLNHMYFSEIEPAVQISKQHRAVTILLRRLKVYRFWLINEFSKIQHYVLGNLCANASARFRRGLESACNLDTLFASHGDFIGDVHDSFVRFKDHNHDSYGFNYLLYLVTKLHLMWNDLKSVDDRELVKFERAYKVCHNSLETVIYPENVNMMY